MPRKITYDPQRDYYHILGLETDATPEDVRLAYRRCVREVHPDLNPERADWATEQIQRVNEAYDVLRNPTKRREYDRLRWPHVPQQPQQGSHDHSYRSPFASTYYDPDRPWWEQSAAQTGYSAAGRARRRTAQATPFWLKVSAWLKAHHLGALEPTWLTLIGLWRSPYASLLTVLAAALALNVAFIVYFLTPEGKIFIDDLRDAVEDAVAEPTAVPIPTPDRLNQACTDSAITIQNPVAFDVVADTFSVYGTLEHPDLWNYTIHLGYLGTDLPRNLVVSYWKIERAPPENQSLPEASVQNGLLTGMPIDLTDRPPGYYAVRVQVTLRDSTVLRPCDVIVQH